MLLSLLVFVCAAFPVFAAESSSSEDYNEAQLSALVEFYQFEIVLEDKETKMQNYEYAEIDLDLNKPWEYPGVTWNTTKPYSVLAIDFSDQPKLSGKLNVSTMNKLQSIDVSGTEIEWVILGDNTELTDINTSGAPVLSLDLSGCLSIENVDCSSSALQQIVMPEHTLKSLHCENNYLTFATLPAVGCASDYGYAPQKNAFFIAQGAINGIEIGAKADMSSYMADEITWYDSDATALDHVTLTKEQTYEFDGLQEDQQIYAVMTNSAFPELTLQTSMITVSKKSNVWLMFWCAVLFFFIIFFAVRYLSAKKKGVELTTDKYTDRIEDWWDESIRKISDRLTKNKKGKK